MAADPPYRPHRPTPLPAEALANAPYVEPGVGDAELLERLDEALARLPLPERAAAMVAFGLAEGSSGVADELGLSPEDAEALARSALQLLRGALADVELDEREVHAQLGRRRRRAGNYRPGDELDGGR